MKFCLIKSIGQKVTGLPYNKSREKALLIVDQYIYIYIIVG